MMARMSFMMKNPCTATLYILYAHGGMREPLRGRKWSMRTRSIGVATIAVAFAAMAFAQDQPSPQEALLKKLATPGEHHQRLDPLAGKWQLAVKWRNKPEEKWSESKGVAQYTWILGGRFLQEQFKYDMAGEPMEWLGIYGYDNFQKQYTAVWVDNMGTNTEFADGKFDP